MKAAIGVTTTAEVDMRSPSIRAPRFRSLIGAAIAVVLAVGTGASANEPEPPPIVRYHFLESASAYYSWGSITHLGQSGHLTVIAGFVNAQGDSDEIPFTAGTALVFLNGSVPSPCGPIPVGGQFPAAVTIDAVTGVALATVTGLRSYSCGAAGSGYGFSMAVEWTATDIAQQVSCCSTDPGGDTNKVYLTRPALSVGAWKWHGIPLLETLPEDLITSAAQIDFRLEAKRIQ